MGEISILYRLGFSHIPVQVAAAAATYGYQQAHAPHNLQPLQPLGQQAGQVTALSNIAYHAGFGFQDPCSPCALQSTSGTEGREPETHGRKIWVLHTHPFPPCLSPKKALPSPSWEQDTVAGWLPEAEHIGFHRHPLACPL